MKLLAVQGFPVPTVKKQVRAFLGLTGYYRKFITHYAKNASPLNDLTKKHVPNWVQWTDSCQKAFVELKAILCSKPVLKTPNFNSGYILQTDASERAIGAVLSQINDNGIERPLAYFSCKLLPREQRYSTIEECLAVRSLQVEHCICTILSDYDL